jgi:hypothetical protein
MALDSFLTGDAAMAAAPLAVKTLNLDSAQPIFPNDFFNIQNPNSPWVSIQFRDMSNSWSEITMNPSNYFDRLSIEDNGGLQTLSLTLVDKNFANLENIIAKAIMAARLANKIYAGTAVETKDAMIVKMNSQSCVNIRIRYGYAENNQDYIDQTSFGADFEARIKSSKTVIRSPWIEFMITNVIYRMTDFGLEATISAISMLENWLDNIKIQRLFSIIKDTPLNIITWIGDVISKSFGGEVTINIEDDPLGPKDEKGNMAKIAIEIGSVEALNKSRPTYMTMRNLMQEVCSRVTPKVVKADGSMIAENDIDDGSMDRTYAYTYSIEKTNNKIKIVFYYPDPASKNTQSNVRTYIWKEYGKSIIKSMEINSKTDWASLNAPFSVRDITSGAVSFYLNTLQKIQVDNNEIKESMDKLNKMANSDDFVKSIQKSTDDFSMISLSASRSNPLSLGKPLTPLAANIVGALNAGLFDGTITIPGDPFYMFDKVLMPFIYAIRLIVMRPGYIDDTNSYTGSNGLQQSYLSGYYVIKKITHTIDINGYNTVLEVFRAPNGG